MELHELVTLVIGVVLILGIRNVGPTERLAVFRAGKCLDIRSPGTTWIIPFLDRAARIDLDDRVPGWRSLEDSQIYDEIERLLREPGHSIPG